MESVITPKSYYIKELGIICQVHSSDYNDSLKKINKQDADLSKISSKNAALFRQTFSSRPDFNQRGHWVAEEIIYNLSNAKNPVIYLGPGPCFFNPEFATYCHRIGMEFFISDPELKAPSRVNTPKINNHKFAWNEYLSELFKTESSLFQSNRISPLEMLTFELPCFFNFGISTKELVNVDTSQISNPIYFKSLPKGMQVAVFLLKEQTKNYTRFLASNSKEKLQFRLLDKQFAELQKEPFARVVWFGNVNDRYDFSAGHSFLTYCMSVCGIKNTESPEVIPAKASA